MIEKSINNLNLEQIGRQWLFFNRYSFKKSTLQTYEYHLNKHIKLSKLSEIPLYNLTPEDISAFSRELIKADLSPKSVNSVLLEINSIFKFAKLMYGFTPPFIRYVKEQNREMRVLLISEQNLLEQYLKDNLDSYNFGILFVLYTGIRVGELCALKWRDIRDGAVKISKTMHRLRDDTGKSVIMIDEPKTPSSNRTIPVPDFLNAIIEERRGEADDFILSKGKIKRVEPRLIQNRFKTIAEECHFDGATFHTLRHTFATRCVECGFDPKTLSEILGHADVKTTLNRYVHSSFELKKNSMNLLTKIVV